MLQKLIAPLALLNKKVFLTIALLISCIIATAQITINTPTLGFTQVCASTTFNNYNLSFSFSPASNLGTGNVFSIELSNAAGSFASPTVLTTSSAITSPVNVSFPFPTNVNGTNYRIRIKSSSPVSTSPSSPAFSANYAVYNQPFTINNNVFNQSICSTSTYSLTIDSGPNSPLNFSQLIYVWEKDGVVLSGQTGPSLPVTTAGSYFVSVNYGTCNYNSYSNAVAITVIPSETLTINSQGNATNICPTTGLLLSSMIASSGYTYQWYLNNVSISSATSATYTATQAGNYSLIASNSACVINSNILVLTENSFALSLDSGAEVNLLPGQNKTLTCTTNASNPTYIWYRNNVELTGQVGNSLSVTQTGTYKVKVKQNTGCILEKEVSTLVSPYTSYNLTIIHDADYTSCENLTETLTVQDFEASSNLITVAVPSNIGVTYIWYKNNVAIIGANSPSYTIANYTDNGNYRVEAKFTDGQIVSSNALDVKLKIDETINLTTDGILCTTNSSVTITSSITDAVFTYQWFMDGDATVLGTNTSYNATVVGDYYLKISLFGCELNSDLIAVSTIDEGQLITNYDEDIYINEGEEITIIASGVDSYEWFIDGVLENSTNEIIVNQEITIQLIAQLNGCEIIRNFTVLIQPKVFSAIIPNTITPNNDGKNDTWIITEELAYQNNVEIVIFSSNQQIVYSTKDYQNNWPLDSISKNNKIFYYKIIRDNSTIYQGTISVIQ
ncbi:gliding motility-associated C-terminal domain-containing protein [uncultured Flavobacterium sp.]|uniref:T9SS type B sorting domain-containing protein n=1 Tax=uncultured Flavobacterium sp. TaxID=165435 RepID=UPI0030EF015E|tara:strand:- start:4902 stop:7091 length:2190 start_codon:yes stop_codon:yes gene_type:complete